MPTRKGCILGGDEDLLPSSSLDVNIFFASMSHMKWLPFFIYEFSAQAEAGRWALTKVSFLKTSEMRSL